MFKYKIKCLFPKDIDQKSDIFLGETSVQIHSFHDNYPSIHLVKSYMLSDENHNERVEGNFYHIFEHKCGTTAINYGQNQFNQVKKYLDLSEYWNIFYLDSSNKFPLMPIPKENFLN